MVSVTSNLALTFGSAAPQQPLVVTPGDEGGPPVAYLPAPGDHLLRHQGKLLLISRRRTSGNPQLAANARLLLEQLTISYLGTSRQPLDSLLREAAAAYNQSQASRTAVHSVDQDGYWTQIGSRPLRPLSSVVLPKGQAEALLADCREFLQSEAWYAHHGIPYRRGYLLHGPPGTGKTSLVMALAGALLLEIYVVTLSSPSMTDEGLRNLLNSAGPRSILLLEDVDAAFVERSASAGASAGRLTFSGLLNAIDGVAAQEGRLLFMTTNHIQRLSNALIRPGRVDVRCFLGPATLQQARELFVSFFRDLPHLMLQPSGGAAAAAADAGAAFLQLADDSAEALAAVQGSSSDVAAAADVAGDTAGRTPSLLLTAAAREQQQAERERALQLLAEQFVAQLPPEAGVSMAQLQGFLMMHRKNPHAAVAGVRHHLQQQQQQRREDAGAGACV